MNTRNCVDLTKGRGHWTTLVNAALNFRGAISHAVSYYIIEYVTFPMILRRETF